MFNALDILRLLLNDLVTLKSQSQRKLVSGASGNMFGVSMGGATGLKGLNSGWQVGEYFKTKSPSRLTTVAGMGICYTFFEAKCLDIICS
jgi:hypothetical protein